MLLPRDRGCFDGRTSRAPVGAGDPPRLLHAPPYLRAPPPPPTRPSPLVPPLWSHVLSQSTSRGSSAQGTGLWPLLVPHPPRVALQADALVCVALGVAAGRGPRPCRLELIKPPTNASCPCPCQGFPWAKDPEQGPHSSPPSGDTVRSVRTRFAGPQSRSGMALCPSRPWVPRRRIPSRGGTSPPGAGGALLLAQSRQGAQWGPPHWECANPSVSPLWIRNQAVSGGLKGMLCSIIGRCEGRAAGLRSGLVGLVGTKRFWRFPGEEGCRACWGPGRGLQLGFSVQLLTSPSLGFLMANGLMLTVRTASCRGSGFIPARCSMRLSLKGFCAVFVTQ